MRQVGHLQELHRDARSTKRKTCRRVLKLGGGPPIDIHRRMQAVYGGKCVIASTVRRSVRKFKQEVGEASLCDQARSVRPVTATGQNPQTC